MAWTNQCAKSRADTEAYARLLADVGVGYVFGNAGGTNAAQRAYWHNNSFTANVVNDIPHESRLKPAEWGTARIE